MIPVGAVETCNEAVQVSWSQVHAFRLGRHHLARRAPRHSLVPVVEDVCGVQAQLTTAAQTALWARIDGLARGDVERALWEDRTLVRTWAMRGTVHLLPARCLPMYAGGLGFRLAEETRRWIGRHGISAREIRAMTEAALDALGGGPLTRRELGERVLAVLGPGARQWIEHSWGGAVKEACLEGRACFGPDQGREITFVRVDQWLALAEPPPEDSINAAARLMRQYLRSYGPATLRDFCSWSGLKARDSAPIWARLKVELVEVRIEGRTAWILREDLDELRNATIDDGQVRLLPSFDPYMLGHHDKSHLVDDPHYKAVFRKAGWLSPIVLARGRVVGVWSLERKAGRLLVAVHPFGRLSRPAREAIELEAASLGRFFGAAREVELEVDTRELGRPAFGSTPGDQRLRGGPT